MWHALATRITKEKAYQDAREWVLLWKRYLSLTVTSLLCIIIAWKGAAPTGSRKRAGSATEELPPKKSKQGKIYLKLSLFLQVKQYSYLCLQWRNH